MNIKKSNVTSTSTKTRLQSKERKQSFNHAIKNQDVNDVFPGCTYLKPTNQNGCGGDGGL